MSAALARELICLESYCICLENLIKFQMLVSNIDGASDGRYSPMLNLSRCTYPYEIFNHSVPFGS